MVEEHTTGPGWNGRASAAPSLPGGARLQKQRLTELLAHVGSDAIADWLRPEGAMEAAYKQVGNLGLIQRDGSEYSLTVDGRELAREPTDDAILVRLHQRLVYVGEMLLRLEQSPARIEELQAHATQTYMLGWKKEDQVRRRLTWLRGLGMAEESGERFHIATDKGRRALADLVLADPAAIAGAGQAERTLSATPPFLAERLSRGASGRRIPIGFLPKDPLAALVLLTDLTRANVERPDLVAEIARRLNLSESSAQSFVATAKILGLHEYVGKDTLRATPLGLEWLETASPINLVRLLHSTHSAVGEVLLHLDDAPSNSGDVHRKTFAGFSDVPTPMRTTTLLRRFADAGAVVEIGHARFSISALGRELREELPLADSFGQKQSDPSDLRLDSYQSRAQAIADELVASSTDIAQPDRFEKAAAAAFTFVGIDARHIGGPGGTDVLLRIESKLNILGTAIVDTKAAASGQLREDSVDFETLKEHARKYDVEHIAVVAPGYENSGRLPERALSNNVVLLTAARLAEIVLEHLLIPYTPEDIRDLLAPGGIDTVTQRRELAEGELAIIERVLRELRAEQRQDQPEAITARDIYRLLRGDLPASESDVAAALRFLSIPQIAAAAEVERGAFALPGRLSGAALRLRHLASVLERVDQEIDDVLRD